MRWIKQKFDIDPGQHVWEIPAVLWWRLKGAVLGDDIGWAENRSIDSHNAMWECLRVYVKMTRSWQDAQECIQHVLAHSQFDERCEYCHYRRCVTKGIGLGS